MLKKIKIILLDKRALLIIINFYIILFVIYTLIDSTSYAEDTPFRVRWPIVNKEIEFGARGYQTIDEDKEKDDESKKRYGLGMGFSDWFFVEIEGEYEKENGENEQFKAYEIDSRFELTKTKSFKEKPNIVDVGVSLGFSIPDDSNDNSEFESRLLLYKRYKAIRATGNLILEKEFKDSVSRGFNLAYGFQVRYSLFPEFQPGVEIFGLLGDIDDISVGNKKHKSGPGIFGFIDISENLAIKYELSWLIGLNNITPQSSIKWLTEFEYKY